MYAAPRFLSDALHVARVWLPHPEARSAAGSSVSVLRRLPADSFSAALVARSMMSRALCRSLRNFALGHRRDRPDSSSSAAPRRASEPAHGEDRCDPLAAALPAQCRCARFLQPHVEILVGTPEPFFLLRQLFQLPALLVDGEASPIFTMTNRMASVSQREEPHTRQVRRRIASSCNLSALARRRFPRRR